MGLDRGLDRAYLSRGAAQDGVFGGDGVGLGLHVGLARDEARGAAGVRGAREVFEAVAELHQYRPQPPWAWWWRRREWPRKEGGKGRVGGGETHARTRHQGEVSAGREAWQESRTTGRRRPLSPVAAEAARSSTEGYRGAYRCRREPR